MLEILLKIVYQTEKLMYQLLDKTLLAYNYWVFLLALLPVVDSIRKSSLSHIIALFLKQTFK